MIRNLLVYLTHPYVNCWNFKSSHEKTLQSAFPELDIRVCRNSKEFLHELPKAESAVVWYFKEKWLERMPELKLIATPAAGADWIDLPQNCAKPKVWFGGFHGTMIAESVVGAMFYFCKAFQFSKDMQRKKKWARRKISAWPSV